MTLSAVRPTSRCWQIIECETWIGDARSTARHWCDQRKKKRQKGDKIEVGMRGVNCFTADVTVTVAVWRRPVVKAKGGSNV